MKKEISKIYVINTFYILIFFLTLSSCSSVAGTSCTNDFAKIKFEQIDINKDEKISFEEYQNIFNLYKPGVLEKMDKVGVRSDYDRFDLNKDNFIDKNEFLDKAKTNSAIQMAVIFTFGGCSGQDLTMEYKELKENKKNEGQITGCIPSNSLIETDVFTGNVTDTEGKPINDAIVKVKVLSDPYNLCKDKEFSIKTDNGYYFFRSSVPSSKFEFTVSKEGYETIVRTETIVSNLESDPKKNVFDFILKKLK